MVWCQGKSGVYDLCCSQSVGGALLTAKQTHSSIVHCKQAIYFALSTGRCCIMDAFLVIFYYRHFDAPHVCGFSDISTCCFCYQHNHIWQPNINNPTDTRRLLTEFKQRSEKAKYLCHWGDIIKHLWEKRALNKMETHLTCCEWLPTITLVKFPHITRWFHLETGAFSSLNTCGVIIQYLTPHWWNNACFPSHPAVASTHRVSASSTVGSPAFQHPYIYYSTH